MNASRLTVDLDRNMLCRNGVEVKVRPKVAEIAAILLERDVTHTDRLLQRVYGFREGDPQTIRVFLSRLRPALAELGCDLKCHFARGYEIVQGEPSTFAVALPASLRPALESLAAASGVTIDAIVAAEVSAALCRL